MMDNLRVKVFRIGRLSFNKSLTYTQRTNLVDDIRNNFVDLKYDERNVKTIPMQYFIKNEKKFRNFARLYQLDSLATELTNQVYSKLPNNLTADPSFKLANEDVFKSGIEIFR